MDKILLLENELEELKNNSNTMKRNESHAVEVIAPPPAPPPPSNSFFNFVGRKNSMWLLFPNILTNEPLELFNY